MNAHSVTLVRLPRARRAQYDTMECIYQRGNISKQRFFGTKTTIPATGYLLFASQSIAIFYSFE
jgi:hypothetical protein